MKVLAVIVTHNREALLARCVEHCLPQLVAPDHLLVVNNASTDGTEAMLHARGVEVLTQANLGSAGGWHRGISEAVARGFDAVWLMDDDGFPDAGALAALRRLLVDGVACASSVVLREDNPARFVFPFPRLDSRGLPRVFAWPRKLQTLDALQRASPDGTYPFAHFFNGALISTTAVARVGNVDQQFFIFGDEVDYFFRLREVGRVVSVLDARHYHPDVTARPYTPAKIYYYIRNTLVLNRRYFDMPWLRNPLAVVAAVVRTMRRNGVLEGLSYLVGRNAVVLRTAVARGLAGQLGKDFNG